MTNKQPTREQYFNGVAVQDAHTPPMSSDQPLTEEVSKPLDLLSIQITQPGTVKVLPLPEGAHPQTQPGLTLDI